MRIITYIPDELAAEIRGFAEQEGSCDFSWTAFLRARCREYAERKRAEAPKERLSAFLKSAAQDDHGCNETI